jgi:pyruvate kinase
VAVRRTKILATLGPATDAPGRLDELVAAGLDGGRINCAHDGPDRWRRRAAALRGAAERAGRPLALVVDLAGPKMRLGEEVRPREVALGELVVFAAGAAAPDVAIEAGWPGLADAVTVGRSEIVIGDGTPRLQVVEARPDAGTVAARCERPGWIGPRKGIFVTYVQSPASTLSERDLADLEVACEGSRRASRASR